MSGWGREREIGGERDQPELVSLKQMNGGNVLVLSQNVAEEDCRDKESKVLGEGEWQVEFEGLTCVNKSYQNTYVGFERVLMALGLQVSN